MLHYFKILRVIRNFYILGLSVNVLKSNFTRLLLLLDFEFCSDR